MGRSTMSRGTGERERSGSGREATACRSSFSSKESEGKMRSMEFRHYKGELQDNLVNTEKEA